MTDQIQTDHFTSALYILLDETFDDVKGIYLDRGTSLFETLAEISSEEASIPVGGKCATLAAKVKHVVFYLDVVYYSTLDPNYPQADWDEIWRTTAAVDQNEWEQIQSGLRESYNRIRQLIADTPTWSGERQIGGAIGVIVHTAYHLGEIRQALCTLRE